MKEMISAFPKLERKNLIDAEIQFLKHRPSTCLLCYLKKLPNTKTINSHCVSQSWQRKLSPSGKLIECWLGTPLDLYQTPIDDTTCKVHLSDSVLKNILSPTKASTFVFLCDKCDKLFLPLDNYETLQLSQETLRLLNLRALLSHFYKYFMICREQNPHLKSLMSAIGHNLYGVDQNKGEYRYKAFFTSTDLPFYTSDPVTLCYDLRNISCRTAYRQPYAAWIHVIPFQMENAIIVSWVDGQQSSKFLRSLSLLHTDDRAIIRLSQRCCYPVFSSEFLMSLDKVKAKRLIASIFNNRENFTRLYNEDVPLPIKITKEIEG